MGQQVMQLKLGNKKQQLATIKWVVYSSYRCGPGLCVYIYWKFAIMIVACMANCYALTAHVRAVGFTIINNQQMTPPFHNKLLANMNFVLLLSIGKTCSVRILQWINKPKKWCNNHKGGVWGDYYYIIHEGCLSTEVSLQCMS